MGSKKHSFQNISEASTRTIPRDTKIPRYHDDQEEKLIATRVQPRQGRLEHD